MTSPFAAAAAAAAASLSAVMAETFVYRPMKRGGDVNAAPSVDPDRPVVEVRMPFSRFGMRAGGAATDTPGVRSERPGHSSDRPFAVLQLSLLPYPPRAGDRLGLGDETFVVAEAVRSMPGFVRLDLNKLA